MTLRSLSIIVLVCKWLNDGHSCFLIITTGHAKDALGLARMQEQTVQLEHQSKVKVGAGGEELITQSVKRGCIDVEVLTSEELIIRTLQSL